MPDSFDFFLLFIHPCYNVEMWVTIDESLGHSQWSVLPPGAQSDLPAQTRNFQGSFDWSEFCQRRPAWCRRLLLRPTAGSCSSQCQRIRRPALTAKVSALRPFYFIFIEIAAFLALAGFLEDLGLVLLQPWYFRPGQRSGLGGQDKILSCT